MILIGQFRDYAILSDLYPYLANQLSQYIPNDKR